MKISRFIKEKIVFIFLALYLIATSWSLFHNGLGNGHDLNHQARIFEMAKGISEGSFPVIWSSNLTYGYGMPLFEFYAPLPYYFGALFYLSGFNLTYSVEAMILFANMITIVGAYFLAKKLFKNQWASILVTGIIALAPYRAVDLYIRAAISEGWAIAFLLWVLLGIIQVIEKKKFAWLLMSFSFAFLVLSHNITALMSLPFLVVFALVYIFLKQKTNREVFFTLLNLVGAGALGLGLSAFYFIPALLEKHFTQIDQFILSSFYDFHQHFLYIRQFLEPWGVWEYGGSGWGPNDEMSYFLGFAQLLVIIVAGMQLVWFILKRKKQKAIKLNLTFHFFLLFLTGFSLLLTLLKVQKLWELIPIAVYFQFPWRLLSISLILIGLLAGSSFSFLAKKQQFIYFVLVFSVLVIFNPRYFRPEKYEDHSAAYQNFADVIRKSTSDNLYDYIPKDINFFEKRGFYLYKKSNSSLSAPATSIFSDKFIADYGPKIIIDQSTLKEFSVQLQKDELVALNIAYYPGWTASANGQGLTLQADENGLVSMMLPKGEHLVQIRLGDTQVRFWSKILSLLSLLTSLSLLIISITFRSKVISPTPSKLAAQ